MSGRSSMRSTCADLGKQLNSKDPNRTFSKSDFSNLSIDNCAKNNLKGIDSINDSGPIINADERDMLEILSNNNEKINNDYDNSSSGLTRSKTTELRHLNLSEPTKASNINPMKTSLMFEKMNDGSLCVANVHNKESKESDCSSQISRESSDSAFKLKTSDSSSSLSSIKLKESGEFLKKTNDSALTPSSFDYESEKISLLPSFNSKKLSESAKFRQKKRPSSATSYDSLYVLNDIKEFPWSEARYRHSAVYYKKSIYFFGGSIGLDLFKPRNKVINVDVPNCSIRTF